MFTRDIREIRPARMPDVRDELVAVYAEDWAQASNKALTEALADVELTALGDWVDENAVASNAALRAEVNRRGLWRAVCGVVAKWTAPRACESARQACDDDIPF